MRFYETQGFLFAIACAPEMIKPSEWLPLIFNEQDASYVDEEEAQSVLQALMDLYNVINTQVYMSEVVVPDGITFTSRALEYVGDNTALGQWSRGFSLGHDWLIKLWEYYTPDALDEELGSTVMILSFFSSRKLAEAFYQEIVKSSDDSLDTFAQKLLGMFEDAMISYAHMGNSIQTALAEERQPQQPFISEEKVGRNDPCPCGSGKKYKKCCLH